MTSAKRQRTAVNHGLVLHVVLFAVAVRLGGSVDDPLPLHDSCALVQVQNSIHVRSDLGASLLQAQIRQQRLRSMPEVERVVSGSSETSAPVSFTNEDVASTADAIVSLGNEQDIVTMNLTRNGNFTVVVNVSARNVSKTWSNRASKTAHAGNLSANVTPNTTDVNVNHKVVASQHRKIAVKTKVDTRNNTKADQEADQEKKSSKEEANSTKGGAEKPFANENITVHRHVLNITRVVKNVHGHGSHNKSQNVTITETITTVNVASTFRVASIYIVLFVPVAVAWAIYVHRDFEARLLVWLVPFTMCAMSIGQDLVNQSLIMILEAPNAISAIQGFSMTIATVVWIALFDQSDFLKTFQCSKIKNWFVVAVCFAIYQLTNHWVYAICSLSERIVITNLSPLVTLGFERLLMPEALKPSISFNGKLALSLMVIGAVLFSFQCPSFTLDGVGAAGLLLLATVPYRLAQRQFLVGMPGTSLAALACIDGLALGVPSIIISCTRNIHFWTIRETFTDPAIAFMLALSILTFVGLHLFGLAMLRMASATNYLVYSNIASLVTVALGIIFFGDRALATTLACLGLAANVASGVWYTADVAQSAALLPQKEQNENQN